MPIKHIHTYLVRPNYGAAEKREGGGTSLKLEGRLFELLNDVYGKAETECDTDISFNQSADGKQTNPCRSLLVDYAAGPTVVRGRRLAERLESFTTHRSGLGLFFLLAGTEGLEVKVMISRFPADSAILAEEGKDTLTVQFLERVFMKSATAYKAAVYRHGSLKDGFWKGRAVDKQINGDRAVSNYWIFEFLDSDFITTAAAGTRRLAVALRAAARKSPNLTVKREIAAAVTLADGFKGRRINVSQFCNQMGLSAASRDAILAEMKLPHLANDLFQFDIQEFRSQVPYRTIELDSGGMLTAQAADFDNVFQQEPIDDGRVRISTEGKIVEEKLSKS